MNDRRGVFEFSADELGAWCQAHGHAAYRARQIHRWIVHRRVTEFAEMSDVPIRLREQLADHWTPIRSTIVRERVDRDGTVKLLIRLCDGQTIECVLMRESTRRTVCLSTQVGCAMGCVFCASGLEGLARNLSSGEIIEQLLHARQQLPKHERLTHIVVMGMGEPLANLGALAPALGFATSRQGLGISARHVTISTVGLTGKIRALAQLGRPYHLAISLHAPNDRLRRSIVPTAGKVSVADLVAAADEYRVLTGRQVTFEYVLLAELNDQPDHARELAQLLGGRDAMINLIPYNTVSGLNFNRPADIAINRFASILRRAGIVVRIRKRKGGSIDAACGQLRRRASTSQQIVTAQ
jgi:23S rRNA (adenine2503-C2)-methyltransferase